MIAPPGVRVRLLDGRAADARRARVPLARAQPRRRATASSTTPRSRAGPSSRSAARPAIQRSWRSSAAGAASPTSVPGSVKAAQAVVGGARRAARRRSSRGASPGAARRSPPPRSPRCYPPLVWISGYAFSEASSGRWGCGRVAHRIDLGSRLTTVRHPRCHCLPASSPASPCSSARRCCSSCRSRRPGFVWKRRPRARAVFLVGAAPRDRAVDGPQLRAPRPVRARRVRRRRHVLDRQSSRSHAAKATWPPTRI